MDAQRLPFLPLCVVKCFLNSNFTHCRKLGYPIHTGLRLLYSYANHTYPSTLVTAKLNQISGGGLITDY